MKLFEWLNQQTSISRKELEYLTKAILEENIHSDKQLAPMALMCLKTALKLRESGMPLAKIINKKPFLNDYFFTTSDTLDPRPETEELISAISIKPRSVLELGIGTGAVLISILNKFNKAKGTGVDISEAALKVAERNVVIHEMQNKISLIKNDWAYGLKGNFDLVICNPPYVSSEATLSKETLHDPAEALFGDELVYAAVLDSLEKIEWQEMIFEVPEHLLNKVLRLVKEKIGNASIFHSEIFDSGIFWVSARR